MSANDALWAPEKITCRIILMYNVIIPDKIVNQSGKLFLQGAYVTGTLFLNPCIVGTGIGSTLLRHAR